MNAYVFVIYVDSSFYVQCREIKTEKRLAGKIHHFRLILGAVLYI
jgi:hypothetical protein